MDSRYLRVVKGIFLDIPNEDILEIPVDPKRKVNRAFDTLSVNKEYHEDKLPKQIILVGHFAYVVKLWTVNNESYVYHIKYTLDLLKTFSNNDVYDIINEI